jgi:hypothetical protein
MIWGCGLAIVLHDKGRKRGRGVNILPTAAGAEENDLREVIVHASELLRGLSVGCQGGGRESAYLVPCRVAGVLARGGGAALAHHRGTDRELRCTREMAYRC